MEAKKGKISQYLNYLQSSLINTNSVILLFIIYKQVPDKRPSSSNSDRMKNIIMLKKTTIPIKANSTKDCNKTQQIYYKVTDLQTPKKNNNNNNKGIVTIRQIGRTSLVTPTPQNIKVMSSSPKKTIHSAKPEKNDYEIPAKNESELIDFLLQELATVETELNESVRYSSNDVKKVSPLKGLTNKITRDGFFKVAIQSPIFSNDKERENYLVKELEVFF